MEPQLLGVGQFCPNEEYEFYQDLEHAKIINYGTTARGMQRYQCKPCWKTFVEATGTLFYGKHTPTVRISWSQWQYWRKGCGSALSAG